MGLALLLFVALGVAASDMFVLTLAGNCTSAGASYMCHVFGASQQTATVVTPTDGLLYQRQELQYGSVVMTLKGSNPSPWQFEESGSFDAGADGFDFAGSGTFSRAADGLLMGAGGYNVTGRGGSFAGRTGRMTALNHGREADQSFQVHLVVQLYPQ
jgi:hypothetical protein